MPKGQETKSKAIVPANEAGGFLALGHAQEGQLSVTQALAQNVGPGGITVADLERVRVPAGGGEFWSVDDGNGKPEAVSMLEGVILQTRDIRGYWPAKYGGPAGGSTPPVCASQDGEIGLCRDDALGLGGECSKCPMAQWGTATNEDGSAAHGQACKSRRLILVLSEDSPLPRVISAPPTSLNAVRRYMVRTLSGGRPPKGQSEVVTGFRLVAEDKGGRKVSVIHPEKVRDLAPEEVVAVRKYAAAILPAFAQVGIENED